MPEYSSADLVELVGYYVAYHEPVRHGRSTIGGPRRVGRVVNTYGAQAVTVQDAVGVKLRVPVEHVLGVYYGDRSRYLSIDEFLVKKAHRAQVSAEGVPA